MDLNYNGNVFARIEASEVEFEKDDNGNRRYVIISRNGKQEHLLLSSQDAKYADYESDTTGIRKGDLVDWSAIMADAEGIYRIVLAYDDPAWGSGKHYLVQEVAWFEGAWERLPEIERIIRARSQQQYVDALQHQASEEVVHNFLRGSFQKNYHAEGRRGAKRAVEA